MNDKPPANDEELSENMTHMPFTDIIHYLQIFFLNKGVAEKELLDAGPSPEKESQYCQK